MKEGAREVHFATYTFDYSPLGEPFLLTARQRAVMEGCLARGEPYKQVVREMLYCRVEELRTDAAAAEQVKNSWRTSGVNGVQVTLGARELDLSSWESVVGDAAYWRHRADMCGDMKICLGPSQLLKAFDEGKTGIVLGMQDAAAFARDLSKIRTLYDFGVRVIQLTYNTRN